MRNENLLNSSGCITKNGVSKALFYYSNVKLDFPDDYLPLVIRALEHYAAYARATQRDATPYQQAVNLFKRKGPGSESAQPEARRGKQG